jgi:hypothetical protein
MVALGMCDVCWNDNANLTGSATVSLPSNTCDTCVQRRGCVMVGAAAGSVLCHDCGCAVGEGCWCGSPDCRNKLLPKASAHTRNERTAG